MKAYEAIHSFAPELPVVVWAISRGKATARLARSAQEAWGQSFGQAIKSIKIKRAPEYDDHVMRRSYGYAAKHKLNAADARQ